MAENHSAPLNLASSGLMSVSSSCIPSISGATEGMLTVTFGIAVGTSTVSTATPPLDEECGKFTEL